MQVHAAMRQELQEGGRIFVVCSRIGAGDDEDIQYRASPATTASACCTIPRGSKALMALRTQSLAAFGFLMPYLGSAAQRSTPFAHALAACKRLQSQRGHAALLA